MKDWSGGGLHSGLECGVIIGKLKQVKKLAIYEIYQLDMEKGVSWSTRIDAKLDFGGY